MALALHAFDHPSPSHAPLRAPSSGFSSVRFVTPLYDRRAASSPRTVERGVHEFEGLIGLAYFSEQPGDEVQLEQRQVP